MGLDRIAVVGAGAWGVALANVGARAGRTITLVARDQKAAAAISQTRESPRLPGVAIEGRVRIAAAVEPRSEAVLLAVPAQALRAVAKTLTVAAGTPVIAAAKGIEQQTLAFMTEIIADTVPRAVPAILSGPSFALDDARGVEIGGAAKNVLAIAAGIVAGKKLGASAGAALTTRGFAELARFGAAL